MNFQLLEELPVINRRSRDIVVSAYKMFTMLTGQLFNFINSNYKENIKVYNEYLNWILRFIKNSYFSVKHIFLVNKSSTRKRFFPIATCWNNKQPGQGI